MQRVRQMPRRKVRRKEERCWLLLPPILLRPEWLKPPEERAVAAATEGLCPQLKREVASQDPDCGNLKLPPLPVAACRVLCLLPPAGPCCGAGGQNCEGPGFLGLRPRMSRPCCSRN